MADCLDDLQLDDLARQQSERPVGVTFRWRPETDGDDFGFLLSVQQLLDRRSRALLSLQRLLKTRLNKALPNCLHCLTATSKGLGDVAVGPGRAIGIGLQQDLGTSHFLAAALELL